MTTIHRSSKITFFLCLLSCFALSPLISQSKSISKWESQLTNSNINCLILEPQNPLLDFEGNISTVIFLQNLCIDNISSISNKKNTEWHLKQGYRVIQMDFKHHHRTISPLINQEIIAINDSIEKGSFLQLNNCSFNRTFILFEGYRVKQNVSYFLDDPSIYNSPKEYIIGDSLYMDIIHPVKPKKPVPVILSFSYSNSYATFDNETQQISHANQHQRLKQAYTLAGFNDSFLEGAPAIHMAWAIADHPKYCQWGKGKTPNSPNDAYKSFQTNPDAMLKVKSAIRTLRAEGEKIGLSGKIGIYGFSRGATAGALALGEQPNAQLDPCKLHIDKNEQVQAAAIGAGVFNYTLIYDQNNDGDKNLQTRCPWVWGELKSNYLKWQTMGAEHFVTSNSAAPVLFFFNTTDEAYYQYQIAHFKQKLQSLKIPTSTLIDYGQGHSVPQSEESLSRLYQFFKENLSPL
ncbi:MAG: alpha/beta hydrolase family protein [Mangrovibacterium sp.]